MLLDFGQPADGIIQFAYVVDDLDAAMDSYVRNLGVGPWFVLRDWLPDEGVYRGNPATARIDLAMAFNGHALIELIQPRDDEPSVYRELLQSTGPGFHHFGVSCLDYDAALDSALAAGHELAFQARVPTGDRVGYVDYHGALPGFVELIEMKPGAEAAFTRFQAAALTWDGSEPFRPFA